MSDVMDLDALMPDQVTIKFGGENIKINPPKTAAVLRLGFLGQKLQTGEDLSEGDLTQIVDQLTEQVVKCVPELADKELNTAQLLKLVSIISEMAIPPETRELEARGITPDTSKKVQ